MKFPYREYISQFPGTSDVRLILRPVIPVRTAGSEAEARWDALVDTGAGETLLPLSLADLLKVELEEATSQEMGISGETLTIHYGPVELQVSSGDETATWQTTVGFVALPSSDDEVIVLGPGGCLDFFTATFDGENAELELIPHSLLPTPLTPQT